MRKILRVSPLCLIILLSLTSCGEFAGLKEDDTDTGNVEKLEVFLDGDDLNRFYSTIALDTSVSCSVIYDGWHGDGTIKVRGETSRIHSDKKSFTLKIDGKKYMLERGQENGGLYNRIIMRAYQLAGLPACDTESIGLFLNGEYLGCYNLITYYDENIIGGELYKCYFPHFDHMENNHPITSLSKKKFPDDDENLVNLGILVAAVTNLSYDEWHRFVLKNVDVEQMAAYMVVHDFFTVTDTKRTNYYMHYDGKYRMLPWDNENCMMEDRSDYNPFDDNQIVARLSEIPEIKAAYNRIMGDLFTGGGSTCILDTLKDEAAAMFDNLCTAMEQDPVYGTSRQDFARIKAYVLSYLDKDTGRSAERDKLVLD